MPTIVISYRRDDVKGIAGRVFDRLEGHYGHGHVFMDVDSMRPGLDFRETIHDTLKRCDILVAVVGPGWLARDEDGKERIADETDWVRLEIETALNKKIPVIPLLVDRTPMPKPSVLPESIRSFAFRHAVDVDSGKDFRMHVDRLIRSMDELLSESRQTVLPAPETSIKPLGPAPLSGMIPDTPPHQATEPAGVTQSSTVHNFNPRVVAVILAATGAICLLFGALDKSIAAALLGLLSLMVSLQLFFMGSAKSSGR